LASEVKNCDASELVDLVHAGDLEALDRITHCFGDRLLAVGRQRCRNEEDARDAVQDAMVSAGQHLTSFRGDGSLEGWLARMVINACYRMRRGRKNDPGLHETEVELQAEDASPEGLAARAELAEALGQAMMRLSPMDRTILILAEGEGWTGPEIARQLELTPGAVRTRLTRIRARMRTALEGLRGQEG